MNRGKHKRPGTLKLGTAPVWSPMSSAVLHGRISCLQEPRALSFHCTMRDALIQHAASTRDSAAGRDGTKGCPESTEAGRIANTVGWESWAVTYRNSRQHRMCPRPNLPAHQACAALTVPRAPCKLASGTWADEICSTGKRASILLALSGWPPPEIPNRAGCLLDPPPPPWVLSYSWGLGREVWA